MVRKLTYNRPTGLIEGSPLSTNPTGMLEAFVLRIEHVNDNMGNNRNCNHGNEVLIH